MSKACRCMAVICCLQLLIRVSCISVKDYNTERQNVEDKEISMRFGHDQKLNPAERRVSEILLKAKRLEFVSARVNGTTFPASVNFFLSKELIEQSTVFKIIKQMPKGGALHTHSSAIVSLDWTIKNVTYRDHCYMCTDKYTNIKFQFFDKPPHNSYCSWELVKTKRLESGNPDQFDRDLISKISIATDHPEVDYPTIDDVWNRFSKYFRTVSGLYKYAPVFEDYVEEMQREFLADNVQYVEIRDELGPVYELDGTRHDEADILRRYREYTKNFINQHSDFIGCKIIQSGSRKSMLDDIKLFMHLHQLFPDILRGYDIVGREGPSHPLQFYLQDFLYPSNLDPPVDVPYFFNAGETDWKGTQVDLNLVDAILLNTSRVGHGYAIYKHPEVMKIIKEKNIAVEVNPISNQVLKLVGDLRNHGAITLFAENYPLVVSSDDPASWGALPLSHDFYVAFMAFTPEDAGLEVLKQLAINSLTYSTLDATEKILALRKWKRRWNIFIQEMLRLHQFGPDIIG